MLSVQEIIREVTTIKESSERLIQTVGVANIDLATHASQLTNLVQGSHTGQDSVMALSVASRSLADAISSMKQLSKTCEGCISELSK